MNSYVNRLRRSVFGILSLSAGMCVTGCGSEAPVEYSGELVPVSGVVMLDGTPVPDASVTFVYDGKAPEGFLSSNGMTDSTGKFQMKTGDELGLPPGRFRVAIEKWQLSNGAPLTDDPDNGMDSGQAMVDGSAKQLIPARYSNTAAGKLTVEIVKGQTDPVNFDLKSK